MSAASYSTVETLPRAIVLGCAGTILSNAEKRFFRDFDPLGFILFQRNCESPDQIRALTASLRESVGRDGAPILIDQEGGRVARLKPPHWPQFPPMQVFGELAKEDHERAMEACFLNARLIAYELNRLGITVDCAPVADLNFPGAHDVIGDRAFGGDPVLVAELSLQVCHGLQLGGIVPIIKHIPGHGRSTVDSHAELPVVDVPRDVLEETDFASFRLLSRPSNLGLPWAMVAHVTYSAIDPSRPASTSSIIIDDIIRIGIGFSGVLIADDIGMSALDGTLAERAEATLSCGNDLTLHCSGKLDEMEAIAGSVRRITPATHARLAESMHVPGKLHPLTEMQEAEESVRSHLEQILPWRPA